MPVPVKMADLFTIAASNSPAGSDPIGNSLDDYLRALQAIIRSTNALASATLSAASTTDLGSADAESVQITGAASISSFGTTAAGIVRECRFTGACTIVNSSAIVIPGATNITTAAGDVIRFRSIGSGNWIYVCGTQQPGYLPVAGGTMTGSVTFAPTAALGNTAGNFYVPTLFQQATSNNDQLVTQHTRVSNGSDWTTAVMSIYRKVDSTQHAFVQFGEATSGTGLAFGSGSSTYATMSGAGAWAFSSRPTFNGNLAWDAGNFNPANYALLSGAIFSGLITANGNMQVNSLFNQSIGTVGTQTNLSNFGWGNGVPRWKQWLETNADFSFYSYDSAGSTPRKTLSIVNTTGVCTAPDFQSLSDVSLKSNIKPLDRGLQALLRLAPCSYEKDGRSEIGFIAQDVAEVVPEAVACRSDGLMTLSHGQLTALITNALQELAGRVSALEA